MARPGAFAILIVIFLWPLGTVTAQSKQYTLEPEAVAAFADQYMAEKLSEYAIPGSAVAIVHKGKIIHLKGYGFDDVAGTMPIDGETTQFRLASTTKVMTSTAAWRLADRGVLDLDADVRPFLLKLGIKPFDETPLTLRQLLNHSAGFDNYDIARQSKPGTTPDLFTFLSHTTGDPNRAPGEAHRYSNHSLALAGYIAAEKAGLDYETLLKQEVFGPAGMATAVIGLPQSGNAGHSTINGRVTRLNANVWNTAPASGMSATGLDMASFMSAFLDAAASRDSKLVTTEGLQAIWSGGGAAPVSEIQSFSLSWQPRYYAGHKSWTHGGSFSGYQNEMALFPSNDVGVFVVFNMDGITNKLTRMFINEFADNFLVNAPVRPTPKAITVALDDYVGSYDYLRSSSSLGTRGDLAGLFSPPLMEVRKDGNSGLKIYGRASMAGEKNWASFVPVAQDLFSSPSDRYENPFGSLYSNSDMFKFTRDDDAAVAYLMDEKYSYRKLGVLDSKLLHRSNLAGLLLFSLILLVLGIRDFFSKKPGRQLPAITMTLGGMGALIALVGPFAYLLLASDPLDGGLTVVSFEETFVWHVLIAMPLLTVFVFAASLFLFLRDAESGGSSVVALSQLRGFVTLAALALALFEFSYWGILV